MKTTKIEVISTGNPVPTALVVTPTGVNDDTQGELVALENVTITDLAQSGTYGTFEFQALAENGETVLVRHDNRTGLEYSEFIKHFSEGDKVNLTGIAAIMNAYQLKTLGLESFDLVNKPAVYASKYAGTVPVNTKIELASGWKRDNLLHT